MQSRYASHASFLTVYIKEAHPEDEWQMDVNVKEDVCYRQPRTLDERVRIASDFRRRFGYTIPLLVDRMDNPADTAYAAWPERLYVIDREGTIVYKGKPGPFGYHPNEVEQWLAQYVSSRPPSAPPTRRSSAPPAPPTGAPCRHTSRAEC